MLAFISCIAGILLILLSGEFLWRKKILSGEFERKYVHILIGVFVASWPWLVSFRSIQVLGLLAITAQLLNRRITLLHYNVFGNRPATNGDIFVSLSIIVCAGLASSKLFFALPMLVLGLADGLAAVVGTRYGSQQAYKIFGQKKTLFGTITFWLVALGVIAIGVLFAPTQINPSHYGWMVIGLPPLLAIIENASPFGLDNLTVPLMAVLILNWLN